MSKERMKDMHNTKCSAQRGQTVLHIFKYLSEEQPERRSAASAHNRTVELTHRCFACPITVELFRCLFFFLCLFTFDS